MLLYTSPEETMTYCFSSIIIICIVIYLIKSRLAKSVSSPMTTLVLQEFKLAKSDEEFELLQITGRNSGFVSWLMTTVGIDNKTIMKINKKEFSIVSSSLFGSSYTVFSINNIASTHCAFYRPFQNIVIGGIIGLIGLVVLFESFPGGMLLLILAAFFGFLYYFNKTIRIMVMTKAGATFGMCFKPSLIENVDVNLNVAEAAVNKINNLIIEKQDK